MKNEYVCKGGCGSVTCNATGTCLGCQSRAKKKKDWTNFPVGSLVTLNDRGRRALGDGPVEVLDHYTCPVRVRVSVTGETEDHDGGLRLKNGNGLVAILPYDWCEPASAKGA